MLCIQFDLLHLILLVLFQEVKEHTLEASKWRPELEEEYEDREEVLLSNNLQRQVLI